MGNTLGKRCGIIYVCKGLLRPWKLIVKKLEALSGRGLDSGILKLSWLEGIDIGRVC